MTALTTAIVIDNLEAVQTLLQHNNIDVNIQDKVSTFYRESITIYALFYLVYTYYSAGLPQLCA